MLTPRLLVDGRARFGRLLFPAEDDGDDDKAGDQRKRAPAGAVELAPTVSMIAAVRPAPTMPPSDDAAADEAEQPLGLARVVDAVGERPELADEQGAEKEAPQIERHRHPLGPCSEERPEENHDAGHDGLRDGQRPAPGQHADQPRVAQHEHADDQARPEDHPGHVDRAQAGDQF